MRSVYLFAVVFFLIVKSPSAFAQWIEYTSANSPITDSTHVALVCSDPQGDKTFIITLDTSYHLVEHSRSLGWRTYPEHDSMLNEINSIQDAKVRNNILWCLTSSGLKMFSGGTWVHIAYPSGISSGFNGKLAIDKLNGIWFTGGAGGHGITYYSTNGAWSHYDATTHPEFKLDFQLSDIKLDEAANTVWIGTNCVNEFAGVYSYNTQSDEITKYENGNDKYRCVHAVEPGKNRLFVGTSNFSSIRIMGVDGIFTQSLDQPKVTWTTSMHLDPLDSQAVWVTTERGLMYFKDTLDYVEFNHGNSALDGFMAGHTVEQLSDDSARVWVATSLGFYSYAYKAGEVHTGIEEPDPLANVQVYPNPSTGLFHLKLDKAAAIAVTDLAGKQVYVSVSQSAGNTTIDLSAQPGGLYFLRLMAGDRVTVRKLFLAE